MSTNKNAAPVKKLQKSTPYGLLKQLKATAALMCYDHKFGQETTKSADMNSTLYNMYNGNEDLNMVCQVDLMCNGKGLYRNMYNVVKNIVVTNTEGGVNTDNMSASLDKNLVLYPALMGYDSHIQFTSGLHFNL